MLSGHQFSTQTILNVVRCAFKSEMKVREKKKKINYSHFNSHTHQVPDVDKSKDTRKKETKRKKKKQRKAQHFL